MLSRALQTRFNGVPKTSGKPITKKKRREKAEYDANEPKATLPSHRLRGLKAFLLVG